MKRFIYGLVSLFAALVLVRASSYGAVGRVIEHTGDRLIGSAGVALLVCILMAVAFHLLVPRVVRKWLLTFPTLIKAKPVRAEVVERPMRRRVPPRQQLVVVTGADLQHLGLQGLMMAMNGGMPQPQPEPVPVSRRITQPVVEVERPVIHPPVRSPAERMCLSDVETALKGLGYRKEEYKFVQEMDGSRPIETLVRESLAKLRKT